MNPVSSEVFLIGMHVIDVTNVSPLLADPRVPSVFRRLPMGILREESGGGGDEQMDVPTTSIQHYSTVLSR